MKIVNREEFIKLPEGTIFEYYSPKNIGDPGLKLKLKTYRGCGQEGKGQDFFFLDLQNCAHVEGEGLVDHHLYLQEHYEGKGPEPTADLESCEREGLVGFDIKYIVWSDADKQALINVLKG